MIRAGAACSTASNPAAAAAEATEAALRQAGLARAAGALCFVTEVHGGAYPLILRTVSDRAGTAEVAGCSGCGVIAEGREVESGPGLAVVVFGDSISARRLFVPQLKGRAEGVADELAAAVAPRLGRNNLLCLFPDTYHAEPGPMLRRLRERLPALPIVGGGASEASSTGQTFQFCGDVVSWNSVAGMLLTGDFEVTVGSSLACAPLGPVYRVTDARAGRMGNLITRLDGRHAFEVFAEAAGPLTADLRRACAFIFLGVPIDPTARCLERGRYVVRNIVHASPELGFLAVAHLPKVGDVVGFLLRDGERARADLKAMLDEVARPDISPRFALYFNCMSRGEALYGIADHDSAYIQKSLGSVPVGGFFTGFEIGPLGGATDLLLHSGVLALVSEKTVRP